jgi:hypothetical protein
MRLLAIRLDPRALAVSLALVSVLACSTLGGWSRREGCPVRPVSSVDLDEMASLRARVRVDVVGEEIGLEVIARVQPDALVVVGLSPDGSVLFEVVQRVTEIELGEGASGRRKTLALIVMDALHRAYWIEPGQGSVKRDGAQSFEWGSELVSDVARAEGGRREFSRAGARRAAPGVVIDYDQSSATAGLDTAEVRSEWCGYRAMIAVLDEG